VFYDDYRNLMIYVNDVDPATGLWKGVFIADNRVDESRDVTTASQAADNLAAPPDDHPEVTAQSQDASGQRLIVAQNGSLTIAEPSKEIWMNLGGAETHIWNPSKPDRYDHTRNQSQRLLLPSPGGDFDATTLARSLREMNLAELIEQERELGRTDREEDRVTRNLARVEIHKKFAIPFACIAFGILGLPLGITNRRGGKSSGFSLSILIILFYYVMINNGEQWAAQGKVPPWLGMWAPNLILLGLGVYLLSRANRDAGASSSEGGLFSKMTRMLKRVFRRRRSASAVEDDPSLLNQLDITFPNTLDRYVLREFLKILGMVLISVIALFVIVDYNEIAKDIRQNNIGLSTLLTYYRFQIFQVIDWTLPISVLVATLVTFGMLAKNNEVTAMKANGVSLYRVSLPVVAVAVVVGILAYFVRDFILPYSTKRVNEVRRKIEGKETRSAAAQQKLWYLGAGRYVINFLSYDRTARQLSEVQVFEFHPTDFKMVRRIYSRTATWTGQAWRFENGWIRSFQDDGNSTFTPIIRPVTLYYRETPEDFATEVKAPEQMSYAELRRYIETVRSSGYAADELEVELWEKTSWPAISVVMALIALPFAFKMGKRGALYGIGLALVLGIVYWMVFAVFTKFGEVGNLPPLLSAWAGNILFALAAVYGFLHVET
ncbi:MAG TPA: LPS export ABC transporter permease LptG, partial [Thermoanaerobaculia bacterium]|nr:LPS export ABC transporter permease LptG [Thermoanaerobaculia bacterium]